MLLCVISLNPIYPPPRPRQKGSQESRSSYEADRIEEAKQIMSPFFLRRLKRHVLRDLPPKTEQVLRVAMTTDQAAKYRQLREGYVKEAKEKVRAREGWVEMNVG